MQYVIKEWYSFESMDDFMSNQLSINERIVFNLGEDDGCSKKYYTMEIPEKNICVSIQKSLLEFSDENVLINQNRILIGLDEWIFWIDTEEKRMITIESNGVCFFYFIRFSENRVIAVSEISILKIDFDGNVHWKAYPPDIVDGCKVINESYLRVKLWGDCSEYLYSLEDGKLFSVKKAKKE
jgi:hypothetical protein